LIVEISYYKGEWDFPTEEPLGSLYFDVDSYFELFRIQGKIYLVHLVDSWGRGPYEYMATFYIIDEEREALEKFLEEVEKITSDRDIELENCEATKKLKTTLANYGKLSRKSVPLERFAEKIIQECQHREE